MTNFSVEKDVEHHIKSILERKTGERFTSPYNTDGYLEFDDVRLLLETKLDALESVDSRTKAIAQTIHYTKTMDTPPNVILVCDSSWFTVFNPDTYLNCINERDNIDWSRPPSSPCPRLIDALKEQSANAYLESISVLKSSSFIDLCKQLAMDCTAKVIITPQSIKHTFERFTDTVLTRLNYDPLARVDMFLSCITRDDEDVYLHPRRPNTLVVDGNEYLIDVKAFHTFFNTFQRGYSPSQIDEFQSTRDQLLSSEVRRKEGVYFTPLIWANEAHDMISSHLGSDWYSDCVVWDCCSGTANLTREFDFDHLILSTAELADVKTITREGYNENAHIFQYDFLNPTSTSPYVNGSNSIPQKVIELLTESAKAGKRIVFLINPPYADASGSNKVSTDTDVRASMPRLGRATRQLYSQFLYQCDAVARTFGFSKISIGAFTPIVPFVSTAYRQFREFWYSKYMFNSGFLIRASHFADVKDVWGISFTLWHEGVTPLDADLNLDIRDFEQGIVSSHIREKSLYSVDNTTDGSKWAMEFAPESSPQDTPKFSSGLSIKEIMGNHRGMHTESLGIMCNMGNSVANSLTSVLLLSGKPTHKGRRNFDLTPDGWRRAIALYSARRLTLDTWESHNDEYLVPNVEAVGYNSWVDDCHVFALMDTKNNMTAMRNASYRESTWNVHNHFFWLSRDEALDIYDNKDALPMYRDAKKSKHDPYFAQIRESLNLSPLAREILDDLTRILKDPSTHKARTNADISEHARSWDIGVYQLNRLLKGTPLWSSLREKFVELREQLRHGVYTYGFLNP